MSVDYALIEIQMDPLAHQPDNSNYRFEFSAYIERPENALNGITPDDWLPIQGVAYSESPPEEYMMAPIIAFPNQDGDAPLAVLSGGNRFFSLKVDLTSFEPNALIRIALYGQIGYYNIIGGNGISDGSAGTLLSSQFQGSLTKDYRGFEDSEWTPSGLSGAPDKFFFVGGGSGYAEAFATLVATFPELSGNSYEALGAGIGDYIINGEFNITPFVTTWTPSDLSSTWGSHSLGATPTSVMPDDTPNAWVWRDLTLDYVGADPFAAITVSEYWGTGILKKKTADCSVLLLGGPEPTDGAVPVTTVPADPGAGYWEADAINIYQIKYYLPTWNFPNYRSGFVKVLALNGINPWRATAQHDSGVIGDNTVNRSWEDPDIYPDRLEMGDSIGTVTLDPGSVDPDGDYTPLNHFNHRRLGYVELDRGSGVATFVPLSEETPPVDGGTTGDGPDGDGTAPGRTANPQLRAWTFTLDGHDFYVLRLGDSLTLVYDTYSEQWMDWTDFDSSTWRAHCGFNWIGSQGLADTYGSSVVVGDDAYGLLWFLDPDQPYDDGVTTGVSYFSRVTVGQVPMNGREVLPCYATWLTADMGAPAYPGCAVTLYTSDDAGVTWDNQGYVRVTTGENSPQLSWYSLGQIGAPGRLFKIFDDGAVTRIDALEMNDPDDK